MEDDDAVLGLTLEMPSVIPGDAHDHGSPNDGKEAHWAAFDAAIKAAQRDEENKGSRHGSGSHGGSAKQDGLSDGSDNGEGAGADNINNEDGETEFTDEQLLLIDRKNEAKQLGHRVYKRWKKLQKRHSGKAKGKSGGDKKSRKGKEKSKKKSRKVDNKDDNDDKRPNPRKRESKKEKLSGKKRARASDGEEEEAVSDGVGGDDDIDPFSMLEADFLASTRAADNRKRHLEGDIQRMQKQQSKRGLTAEQRYARAEELAKKLVADMQVAQRQDERVLASCGATGALPLNRIAIRDKVETMCRRQFLVGPLVEAGILQELSRWLYDMDRGEPAPYELRSTALDILVNIPIEGELAMKETEREDLTRFIGLSKEDLTPTDLGRAVNALRLHQQETSENRSKCVRLLERLSRAYAGRFASSSSMTSGSGSADGQGVVAWKCKSDPRVRSPFEVVQTGSQSFQQAFMKPDPQDPTSYNNLLPWRPPVRSITNLSNNLAEKLLNNDSQGSAGAAAGARSSKRRGGYSDLAD